MRVDFLIVGQGLAGSLLAWELIQRNARVIVVDNTAENASRIAAGIINPITGQRFVKSRDIDTLLPTALAYYHALSAVFQHDFFCPKPLVRLLRSPSELTQCRKRLALTEYSDYLCNLHAEDQHFANFSSPFGYLIQRQTGHLRTVALLDALKAFFIARNAYREGQFNYAAVELSSEVKWQAISAKQLIFSEGYCVRHNPWFSWLPFQLAKGEILTLSYDGLLTNNLINFGHWLLPINNSQFRIGATFDTVQLDVQPTAQGKTALLASLASVNSELAGAPLIAHQANIRPCTLDKQPFLGRHPIHANVLLFNGFGAKGSLQIPWYCQRFADYLIDKIPLPSNCDIKRHVPSYFAG
jgi:glycine/D-amino acid oxidase-like deaminating enzyme